MIGIEKIRVYPGTLSLDLAALSAARGHDPSHLRDNLLVDERSLNPPWEDSVTMAVNAARGLLDPDDRASIGLLIVGTETSLDQEKPLSSWVHGFLDLPSTCRNFELKHACYSGTAGLQMAASWLASGLARGKKALVITADQSLVGFGKPWEYILGAGAVAMLVSDRPDFLELELGRCGVYAHEVCDVIRPTARVETGNSETSLYSYIEALEGAYTHYQASVGEVDFETYFQRLAYHTPYGGASYRAHRTLLQREAPAISKSEARAHFERKAGASLRHVRRIGNTYGGSAFIALLGVVDGGPDLTAGDRIGIYSYGSGSCAEFYSGLVGRRAQEIARDAGVAALLDARQAVAVEEYEDIEREREAGIGVESFTPRLDRGAGWYERHYQGRGALVLDHVDNYVRHYRWS